MAKVPLNPGMFYHIFNRGNNRENIFVHERNYDYFMHLYARHVVPVVETYAYCLLRNHFHFLVRIKPSPIPKPASQAFSNFFNAYARGFNNAYKRSGALFQRAFGRIQVTSGTHFAMLVVYIHQNPQKHGFVDDFREWPYSSYQSTISEKPTFVQRQQVVDWFGDVHAYKSAHDVQMRWLDVLPLISDAID